jgi:hypothetical protein
VALTKRNACAMTKTTQTATTRNARFAGTLADLPEEDLRFLATLDERNADSNEREPQTAR